MNKKIIKIISTVLTVTFICQDIGWAGPSLSSSHNTLQPKSAIPELGREFRREYEERQVGYGITDEDEATIRESLGRVSDSEVRDMAGKALGINVSVPVFAEDALVDRTAVGLLQEADLSKIPDNPKMGVDVKKIIRDVVKMLLQETELAEQIEEIYIFGSVARGTASIQRRNKDYPSDIDFFVKFKDMPKTGGKMVPHNREFYSRIGRLRSLLEGVQAKAIDVFNLNIDVYHNAIAHPEVDRGVDEVDWKIAANFEAAAEKPVDRILIWGRKLDEISASVPVSDKSKISVLNGDALDKMERDFTFTKNDYSVILNDEVLFDRIHELKLRFWYIGLMLKDSLKDQQRKNEAEQLLKRMYEGLAAGYYEDKQYYEGRIQDDFIKLQELIKEDQWEEIESLITDIEEEYGLEEVRDIDSELKFLGIVGFGRNAVLKKVQWRGQVYVLKQSTNLYHDYYDEDPLIDLEYDVMRDLDKLGISRGVKIAPKAYKIYKGKAILMEFIDGTNLLEAGPKSQDMAFFTRLGEIVRILFEKSYNVTDLRDENIMVTKDRRPILIDFAFYMKYEASEKEKYRQQLKRTLEKLREKYLRDSHSRERRTGNRRYKGVLSPTYSLTNIIAGMASKNFREDFVVPLFEETVLLLGFLCGNWGYIIGRLIFVILHAFQNRAPPVGEKRTLVEKIFLPGLMSVIPIISFIFLNNVSISTVYFLGVIAHVLSNLYVTLMLTRLQKGNVRGGKKTQKIQSEEISVTGCSLVRIFKVMESSHRELKRYFDLPNPKDFPEDRIVRERYIEGRRIEIIFYKRMSGVQVVWAIGRNNIPDIGSLLGFKIRSDILKIKSDEIGINPKDLAGIFVGGDKYRPFIKSFFILPDPNEPGQDKITREHEIHGNKVSIKFYKRLSGGRNIWTFNRSDASKIAELLGLKLRKIADDIKEDEIAVSERYLSLYFISGPEKADDIKSFFNLPDVYESEENVIEWSGEATGGTVRINFYKRMLKSGRIMWVFNKKDAYKIADILGLRINNGISKIESDEIPVSVDGLDEVFVAGQYMVKKIKSLLSLPDEIESEENETARTVRVDGKDVQIIFYKRRNGPGIVWVFKKSDIPVIGNFLRRRQKKDNDMKLEPDEVVISEYGLDKVFVNGRRRVGSINKYFNLPNADETKENEIMRDVKVKDGENIKIMFYKRFYGSSCVWVFKENHIAVIADLLGLVIGRKMPEIGGNEHAVSCKGLDEVFVGGKRKYKHFVRYFSLPDVDDFAGDEIIYEKELEGRKIIIKFHKRLHKGARLWAFSKDSSIDIAKLISFNIRTEIKEIGIDEISLARVSLSKIFISSWEKEELDKLKSFFRLPPEGNLGENEVVRKAKIDGKDSQIIFYRRKSGAQIIWAFKKGDASKIAHLLGLKLRENNEDKETISMIEKILKDLFSDNVIFLATRYGMDIKNILWSIVGAQLRGKYDKRQIEVLIDQAIVQFIDESIGNTREGSIVSPVKTEEGQVEEPKDYRPEPMDPKKISELAERMVKKIEEKVIDKGLKEIARKQAGVIIKKLEERYFFRTYYNSNPDQYTGLRAKEGLARIIQEETNPLVIEILNELIAEIEEAIALQEDLHKKGLSRQTNLNLYQLVGVLKILRSQNVILADEMGLGKTLETIAAFLLSDAEEMLTVVPRPVLMRWMDDLVRHTDIEIDLVCLARDMPAVDFSQNPKIHVRHIRDSKERNEYLLNERESNGRRRIVLVNYELMRNVAKTRIKQKKGPIGTDFIALDEGHLLKNRNAAVSRAIFGKEGKNGVTRNPISARYKVIITGTPLENKPSDLFAPLKYLARKGHGYDEEMFSILDMLRFSLIFEKVNVAQLSLLHSYLTERMIRRLKEDVVTGLPRKIMKTAKVDPLKGTLTIVNGKELSEGAIELGGNYSRQLDIYETALNDPSEFEKRIVNKAGDVFADDEEELEETSEKARQILRLEQAAISPGIFGEEGDSIKFDAVRHLIEERLAQGKSVLVFTNFRTVAMQLRDHLGSENADTLAYIDGTVVDKNGNQRRSREIRRFQEKEAGLMIATVGTMGLGVELTQADSIIFLNNPWKPSTLNQAIDRAHRLDTKRNYGGKELEIISVEFDVPVSIDRLKSDVLKRKNIIGEMIVEGNLTPEILDAFRESDTRIIGEIEYGAQNDVVLDQHELGLLQKFRLKMGEIVQTKDIEKLRALLDEISFLYMQILEHKGSFFANMASLDYLSGHEFPELKGRELSVLDLGSGPSTLYRAYDRKRKKFEHRKFTLKITDYDLSSEMLRNGVPREKGQVLGSFEDLGKKYGEAVFDIVNLSYAFRYAASPAKLIKDIHKILKENGLFILILPKTNIIPQRFFDAIREAGFDMKVGKGGKLNAFLDRETYEKLRREYGQEFADDVAKEVEGDFTYLVANKKRPVSGEIKDEDLRIGRTIPRMTREKADKLTNTGGKIRILPEDGMISGVVTLREDKISQANDVNKNLKQIISGIGILIGNLKRTNDPAKVLRAIAGKLDGISHLVRRNKDELDGAAAERLISILTRFRRELERESDIVAQIDGIIGVLKSSQTPHMEGLRLKDGRIGLWVNGEDISSEAGLKKRKEEISAQADKVTYNIDGGQVVVSGELKKALEQSGTDYSWLKKYLKKLFQNEETRPGQDIVFVDLLDESECLFEDHKLNGYIGVNKQLFEIQDQGLRIKLLKLGLRHELRHEAGTTKTEQELLAEDVIWSIKMGISDKEIEILRKYGLLDKESKFIIERIKTSVAWDCYRLMPDRDTAQKIIKGEVIEQMGKVYNKANVLAMTREEALDPVKAIQESGRIAGEYERKARLIDIANNIVDLYKGRSDKESALRIFKDVLIKTAQEITDDLYRLEALLGIYQAVSNLYSNAGLKDKALELIKGEALDPIMGMQCDFSGDKNGKVFKRYESYTEFSEEGFGADDEGIAYLIRRDFFRMKNMALLGVYQAIGRLYKDSMEKEAAYQRISREALEPAKTIEFDDPNYLSVKIEALVNIYNSMMHTIMNNADKEVILRTIKHDMLALVKMGLEEIPDSEASSEILISFVKIIVSAHVNMFDKETALRLIREDILGLVNEIMFEHNRNDVLSIILRLMIDLSGTAHEETLKFVLSDFCELFVLFQKDSFDTGLLNTLPSDISAAYSKLQDRHIKLRLAYLNNRVVRGKYSLKDRVTALLSNHANEIISYTIDRVIVYGDRGKRHILRGLISLYSKIKYRGYKFDKLMTEMADSDITTDDVLKILKEMGYSISEQGYILSPLNLVTSVYRGSRYIDHGESQYVTHSITTALCHYAVEGGEQSKEGEPGVIARGNKALHEIDYALMEYGADGDEIDGEIDEHVALAFSCGLPECARKRTILIENKNALEIMEEVRVKQEEERLSEENILNLFTWISNSRVRQDSIKLAVAEIRKNVKSLKSIQNEYYWLGLYGCLDAKFYLELGLRYSANNNNGVLLENLLREARRRQSKRLKSKPMDLPRYDVFLRDLEWRNKNWDEDGLSVTGYLKFKKEMRRGTYEERDISDKLVKLEKVNVPISRDKGVLVPTYWLASKIASKTGKSFREDFIVPVIEEIVLLLGFLFGNWGYVIGRIIFVALHAFQNRAPPDGEKRTLVEKIFLPSLMSAISFMPFIFLDPVSVSAVYSVGVIAHVLSNLYVTLSGSKLQKGVVERNSPGIVEIKREYPQELIDHIEKLVAYYKKSRLYPNSSVAAMIYFFEEVGRQNVINSWLKDPYSFSVSEEELGRLGDDAVKIVRSLKAEDALKAKIGPAWERSPKDFMSAIKILYEKGFNYRTGKLTVMDTFRRIGINLVAECFEERLEDLAITVVRYDLDIKDEVLGINWKKDLENVNGIIKDAEIQSILKELPDNIKESFRVELFMMVHKGMEEKDIKKRLIEKYRRALRYNRAYHRYLFPLEIEIGIFSNYWNEFPEAEARLFCDLLGVKFFRGGFGVGYNIHSLTNYACVEPYSDLFENTGFIPKYDSLDIYDRIVSCDKDVHRMKVSMPYEDSWDSQQLEDGVSTIVMATGILYSPEELCEKGRMEDIIKFTKGFSGKDSIEMNHLALKKAGDRSGKDTDYYKAIRAAGVLYSCLAASLKDAGQRDEIEEKLSNVWNSFVKDYKRIMNEYKGRVDAQPISNTFSSMYHAQRVMSLMIELRTKRGDIMRDLEALINRQIETAESILESTIVSNVSIDGSIVDEKYGNKARCLSELRNAGISILPAAAIRLNANIGFADKDMEAIKQLVSYIEHESVSVFGDTVNGPLLLAVRSSPMKSAPGKYDTVLNIGMNRNTVRSLARFTSEEFAYEVYAKFIRNYTELIIRPPEKILKKALGKKPDDVSWKDFAVYLLGILEKHGCGIPEDPYIQLINAINAVFEGMKDSEGGIVVQKMVFGNLNSNSMSGVLFTRNPDTGENKLCGRIKRKAQGDAIVMGNEGEDFDRIRDKNLLRQIRKIKKQLEKRFRMAQDVEFVVEDGKLYIVQTRDAVIPNSAIQDKIWQDMVKEGIIKESVRVGLISGLLEETGVIVYKAKDSSGKLKIAGRGKGVGGYAVQGKVITLKEFHKTAVSAVDLLYVNEEELHSEEVINLVYSGRIKGLVTDSKNVFCHAAILCRLRHIPAIFAFSGNIPSGENALLDSDKGILYFVSGEGRHLDEIDLSLNVKGIDISKVKQDAERLAGRYSDIADLTRLHVDKFIELRKAIDEGREDDALYLNFLVHFIHIVLENRKKEERRKAVNKVVFMQEEDEFYEWNKRLGDLRIEGRTDELAPVSAESVFEMEARVRQYAERMPVIKELRGKYGDALCVRIEHAQKHATQGGDYFTLIVYAINKTRRIYERSFSIGWRSETQGFAYETPRMKEAYAEARRIAGNYPGAVVNKWFSIGGYHDRGIHSGSFNITVDLPEEGSTASKFSDGAVELAQENIGKGAQFDINGDRLAIRKDDVVLIEECPINTASDICLDRIKALAKSLNVYKEFGEGFTDFLDVLKIMVFTGSEESRAAGALGHMENGVLYIDEMLINDDMVVIHEAIHAYLMDKDVDALLKGVPLENKIRRKAKGNPAALRHYYARYYLQNYAVGKYPASDNEKLTNEIRINIIANELGINVDTLKGLLSDLGNNDIALKTKFLRLIKRNGEIGSGEVEVLVKNIERVRDVLNRLELLVSGRDKKEAIKRIALYLSILDVKKINEIDETPRCMQRLADELISAGVFKDKDAAEKIVKELSGKDFYIADIYLRRMEEVGINGEFVNVVREYLFLKAQIGRLLEVDAKDVATVTPATNIAKFVEGYLKNKEHKGMIVEALARYVLGGEDRDLLKISERMEKSIQSIIRAKEIVEDAEMPGDGISEFRRGIESIYEAAGVPAKIMDSKILFQHVDIYVSGNPDWDRKNLDDNIIRLIKDLVTKRQLIFVYNDNKQKEDFKKLFKEVSGEEINEGNFVNELDLDLFKTESIYAVKTRSQCQESNVGKSRIIVAGESGITDLYLMWQIVLARADRSELDESFWAGIKNFLSVYYKDDILAQEAVASMKQGGVYLILPKVAPFIREYFDALKDARNAIEQAA